MINIEDEFYRLIQNVYREIKDVSSDGELSTSERESLEQMVFDKTGIYNDANSWGCSDSWNSSDCEI